jgi:hypothetical protein
MPTGEGGLDAGQSPTQAGGSGEGAQNAGGSGSDYNNEEFLRDLLADGLVSTDDVTQKRGAQPPAQSDKTGSEAGAEPHKVEPSQDKDKSQDKTEAAAPPPDQAKADAQLPGPSEGEVEQLPLEEKWRREAQTEKDKRYAAEQEKERLLDELSLRRQSDAENQLQAEHNQYTAPQRNLVNSLYSQWAAATQEGDTETANLLSHQWNQAKQTLDFMDGQYSQTIEGRKQQKAEQGRQQHLKVLERQLKEDFDTSLEDLKKVKPDLNPFDPFSLQKAIASVHKERVKAAETKARVDAEKILDVARTKWGYTDPGAQPDRATNGGIGRDRGEVDYTGMSVDAILADALADLDTTPARRK